MHSSNFALALAHAWSNSSRKSGDDEKYIADEKEILLGYCKKQQQIKELESRVATLMLKKEIAPKNVWHDFFYMKIFKKK